MNLLTVKMLNKAIHPLLPGKCGKGLQEAALDIFKHHGTNTNRKAVLQLALASIPLNSHTKRKLINDLIPLYGALFQWAQLGLPHFSLTTDFFSAIALTDFGDPTDEPLYMPFPVFTVSFPATEFFNNATKLLIHTVPTAVTKNKITEDGLYRVILLAKAPIYTQWEIGATRRKVMSETGIEIPDPLCPPITADEKTLFLRMRVLLANLMTYIEANGGLPTTQRTHKSIPAPVELVHSTRPLFEVGRTVKLDGSIRRALLERAKNKESWHVAQRFIVRGHWRNHAYGEKKLLRRRQWIEPHWKGPKDAVEAVNKTYEVV